jgi:hypothetical protein
VRKVPVRRLDTLVEKGVVDLSSYNMLYVDVQGNEFKLMKGAEKSLRSFDFIFCEVNFIPLYQESTLWDDFKVYMLNQGFKLVNLRKLEGSQDAQGEALFFRDDLKW